MGWNQFKKISVSEQKVKRYGEFVENGGWHFGFLGGLEGIRTKYKTPTTYLSQNDTASAKYYPGDIKIYCE